jgi:hypothetical protein
MNAIQEMQEFYFNLIYPGWFDGVKFTVHAESHDQAVAQLVFAMRSVPGFEVIWKENHGPIGAESTTRGADTMELTETQLQVLLARIEGRLRVLRFETKHERDDEIRDAIAALVEERWKDFDLKS